MFIFINTSIFNNTSDQISYTVSKIFIGKQFFFKVSSNLKHENHIDIQIV